MKQDKSIKSKINKIELVEKTVEKIGKFLKTKRGTSFVSNLHTAPFRELCRRYNVPKFILLFNNDTRNLNLVKAAIKQYDIQLPTRTKTTRLEAPKQPKTAIKLTAEEHKTYNKAHSPRKMGFAALMHAYEEHKMRKFEKKHPAPTEQQLKEDLFPEELKKAYDVMLYEARYKIRQQIVSSYYKLPIIGRYKDNNDKYIEKILTEIKDIRGGGHCINELPENHALMRKIQNIANNVYKIDNNLVSIRVKGYNKVGRIVLPEK